MKRLIEVLVATWAVMLVAAVVVSSCGCATTWPPIIPVPPVVTNAPPVPSPNPQPDPSALPHGAPCQPDARDLTPEIINTGLPGFEDVRFLVGLEPSCDFLKVPAGAVTFAPGAGDTVTVSTVDFQSHGLVYSVDGFRVNSSSSALIPGHTITMTPAQREGAFRVYWRAYEAK